MMLEDADEADVPNLRDSQPVTPVGTKIETQNVHRVQRLELRLLCC